MSHTHHYKAIIEWTGNTGTGTSAYRDYARSHNIRIEGKAGIAGSSDPAFLGDPASHSPEDLFLSSISACHMLWYLHYCAVNGVVVTAYEDAAHATMLETADGGHFTEVILHPLVTVEDASMIEKANALHQRAHHSCYLANSCNFPIRHEAKAVVV